MNPCNCTLLLKPVLYIIFKITVTKNGENDQLTQVNS